MFKISITTELIQFYFLGNTSHSSTKQFYAIFIFIFKPWNVFGYFSDPFLPLEIHIHRGLERSRELIKINVQMVPWSKDEIQEDRGVSDLCKDEERLPDLYVRLGVWSSRSGENTFSLIFYENCVNAIAPRQLQLIFIQ